MSEGQVPPARTGEGVRGQLRRAVLLLAGGGTMLAALFVALLAVLVLGAGRGRDVDRAAGAPQPRGLSAAEIVPQSPPEGVEVWVQGRHAGRPVPRRFLGLSFELSSLGQIAQLAGRGNLVALLRSLGPGMLRFGGVSADTRVAWTDPETPLPPWASAALEAGQLRELAALARRSDWRVLLTLGLVHYEPQAAAREAAAARAALGRRLAAIEIGNEPDAYARHHFRELPWGYRDYFDEVAGYRSAIAQLARRLALAGPDVSGSHAFVKWGSDEALRPHPVMLTGHHYPLGCRSTPPPSIETLLSGLTQWLERSSLARYMRVARARRIPFRMDETNTVSCGGQPGVSDTFASALWAVRYITAAMAEGVAGINLHGNPANCHGYSPLCAASPARLAAGLLTPQPEWYALLLTRGLIGDRPLRTVVGSTPADVTASALRAGRHVLHVVLVDGDPPGAPGAAVRVHVGQAWRSARVLALSAPSPEALSGVRLGGSAVARDGSWHEPARLPQLPASGGAIAIDLPPSSAVLLTIRR